jgi:hypothetical protein
LRKSHARHSTHQQKPDDALQFADARAETHEIALLTGYAAAPCSLTKAITTIYMKIRRQFSCWRIKFA